MTFTITRDPKALNTLISKAVKAGVTYRKLLHAAAVSALVHAAVTGRCQPLNTLYESLATNDKTAMRSSYITRIHAALGGLDWEEYTDTDGKALVVPSDVMDAAKEAGQWLTFSAKNGFQVERGKMDIRKGFLALAEGKLINPDGVVWRPFFDRNNLAEMKSFGDNEFLKELRNLVEKAKGKKKDTESTVSTKAIKAAESALDVVESINELANELIIKPAKKAREVHTVTV